MITSVNNPLIKSTAKLQQKKIRDESNTYIIEGEHLIEEAQKKGLIKTIFTTNDKTKYKEAVLLSPHVMKKITDTKHVPPFAAIVYKHEAKHIGPQVLILEQIQDPGNLGTLLRSALAFNFTTVILDDCVDLYNPKVLRAAQGAHFHLNILTQSFETFKHNQPHSIIATGLKGTTLKPHKSPYALVLGNEGHGLKPQTLNQADSIITIPIQHIDSLNVAIAGSIIMHSLSQNEL